MSKGKQYTNEFKSNAAQYRFSHPELSVSECAINLGVGKSTLAKWIAIHKQEGVVKTRGSGNYMSDEVKEMARIKKENKDLKDALYVLKKAMGILTND